NVRAFLEQAAVGHLDGGIGERRDDMGTLVDVLRTVADLDLDVVLCGHLAAERFAVRARRTEHHELLDRAHASEGLHVRARHAAGPSMPTTSASSFAMYLTPMPPSPPTRICWRWPSLRKASGSPFSIEVSRIRPQNRPGRMQYFSCVTAPLYSVS